MFNVLKTKNVNLNTKLLNMPLKTLDRKRVFETEERTQSKKRMKKGVLKNFAKFTGKHLPCRPKAWRLQHRCFPVNFAKFFRARFLQNTSRRLLL